MRRAAHPWMWLAKRQLSLRLWVLILLAALVVLLSRSAAGAEAPQPAFSMDRTSLAFDPSGLPDAQVFVLTLAGDAAAQTCELNLTPLTTPDSRAWELELSKGAPKIEAATRQWLVTAKITRMPQTAGQFQRRFIAKCGSAEQYMRLTVDTGGGAAFSWKISGLDLNSWDGAEPLPFQIYVGPRAANGIRVTSSSVRAGARRLDVPFSVCASAKPCVAGSLDLAANKSYGLWLAPQLGADAKAKQSEVVAGDYSGAMTFVAAENPAGTDVAVRLQVTSDFSRWIGVGLIFCGLAAAFLLNQVLTGLANRNALLRPAALLRDELERLAAERARSPLLLGTFDRAISQLRTELAQSNLRKFLPASFQILPTSQAPAVGETYQEFLTRLSSKLGGLALLFASGIMPAAEELEGAIPPGERQIIEQTLDRLDAFAGTTKSPESSAAAIQAELQAMHDALAAERKMADEADVLRSPGYSSESIAFQAVVIQVGAWLLFAVLSLVVGTLALILRNPSFGTTEDLLFCLLWGVGLPATVQGLAGQTGGTIASTLGLRLTRPT